MVRYIACLAAALVAGASLRAGELDAEFGPKGPVASAAPQKAATPVKPTTALAGDATADAWKASELDGETPTQCWGCGWRGCGWGCGWGGWGCGWGGCRWGGCRWGGCGWGGAYASWPCYAYYPPCVTYGYYGCPGLGLYW